MDDGRLGANKMERPDYINAVDKLPKSHPEWVRWRALEEIFFSMAHYTADRMKASARPEEEIAHLVGDAAYHISKNWAAPGQRPAYGFGLMYHFAIFQSGRIYQTQPETLITWHCSDGNRKALGTVCVLGDGEEPSKEMLATLKQHLDWLCFGRTDLPNVVRERTFGHGETPKVHGGGPDWGNSTQCPGKALPLVRAFRRGLVEPPPGPTPPQPTPPPNSPESRYFVETGHSIGHGFKDCWQQFGDDGVSLRVFGYPIGEETSERGLTVQYFERAVFEYHPEAPEGWRVQLRRLGALALEGAQVAGCGCR